MVAVKLLNINLKDYLDAIKTGAYKKEKFKEKYGVYLWQVKEKVEENQYVLI